MTHFRTAMAALAVLPLLAACEGRQSQNQYDYSEVGKSNVAEFGTVAGVREVDVKGQNSGAGALAGGVGGGIAGNAFGNGYGQVTTAVAGALIGGCGACGRAGRS
jgi:outer membrane lipoprotein SlyB